jgi:YD repeat-containing protein
MATQHNARCLSTNEQAGNGGYTHIVVLNPVTDLTETTNNTSMTFNIAPTIAGDTIVKYALRLQPALKNSADAAFNSTTVSFGDASSATRFISGVETNENGTEVIHTFGNTAYTYTAAGQLTVTVNAMSGKNLAALNTGQLVIMFELLRHATLGQAITGLGGA